MNEKINVSISISLNQAYRSRKSVRQ